MFEYRKKCAALAFTAFAFLALGTNSSAQVTESVEALKNTTTSPERLSASFAEVTKIVEPAVVSIDTKGKVPDVTAKSTDPKEDPDDMLELFRRQLQQRPSRSVGSGFIVDKSGYILTNAHVVEDSSRITVKLVSGEEYVAKIIGTDTETDLAVLKIDAGKTLPFVKLGNSDNALVGDWVIAIGSPFGLARTVTAGIVSQTKRETPYGSAFQKFIQTDAAINRGNSGGALVNLQGELIGINSQILSPSGGNIGIGFSIPSNMAKSVMDQLIEHGKVRRGQLGVNIQNITEDTAKALDLKETKGVLVSNVKTGSAADKAGVKRGDIIIAINGEKIDDGNTLRNKVAGTLPGNSIKLTVVRNGEQQELTATLDEFQLDTEKASNNGSETNRGDGTENKPTGKLGLSLQPVTPQIAKQLNLDGAEGLVVVEVEQSGAAAEEGIIRGDVILEINKKTVTSLEDVEKALEQADGKPILLLVNRKNQITYVTVTPK